MVYTAQGAAKINLALDVLFRRPDGYHEMSMIMQTVSLYDKVTVKPVETGIHITTNSLKIPTDSTNIVYKAAEYLKNKYGVQSGASIHIEKNIPVEAGLAGGSTDAACTLKLLNKAWELRLTEQELLDAGQQLGADVPFCIIGGTALAQGIGEKLTPIKPMPSCYVLLAKPGFGVSTKEVFSNLRLGEVIQKPDIEQMRQAIEAGDIQRIAKNMKNVLEEVTIPKHPVIEHIKKRLIEKGALGAMMSGSGPTVFALFEGLDAAQKAKDSLVELAQEIHIAETVEKGMDVF